MRAIPGKGTWKVVWLAIVLLTLGLLGCAPAAPERPAAPAEKPPGAVLTPVAPQPKYGGTVTYMASSGANTLNPYVTGGPQDRRTVGPIYENLMRYNYKVGVDHRVDRELMPWLAEGWEQPNETTYIFKIRKGVKWHDGQDFTADDVVFSYEYARDPKNAFVRVAGYLYPVNTIEATDKYTVKMTTKGPTASLPGDLAEEYVMILPKHVFDRGDKFEKVAIGTGPFKFKFFDSTSKSQFVRNEDYWQKGKPYPNGIEAYYGMDRSATMSAFVSKKFDVIHIDDQPQLDSVLKILPDVKYGTAYGDYGYSILMKLDKPPFNDIRVRKAMHLAIDRQSLIKTAGLGNAVANPPGLPGFATGWVIPQEELLKLPGYRQPKDEDLAEAKRLLVEAGYPNGFKSPTTISTEYSSSRRLSEPIASQLKNVGIELTLEGTTTAALMTKLQKGDYEAAMVLGTSLRWDYQWDFLHSKGGYNKYGLNDPKLDEYLEAQKFVLDREKRKKASIDLQRLLLEKFYYISSIELGYFPAWQPWVQDYYYNPGANAFMDIQAVSTIWMDVDKMPPERR